MEDDRAESRDRVRVVWLGSIDPRLLGPRAVVRTPCRPVRITLSYTASQREAALEAETAAANGHGNGHGKGGDWDNDGSNDDGSDGDSDPGYGDGYDNGGGFSGRAQPPPRRRRPVGPSLHQLLRDLNRDWSQHVTLRQVDVAETFGVACVTSLTCLQAAGGGGTLVVAADFLGSVTVMRLVANRRGPALIAVSPDRHPLYTQVGWGGMEWGFTASCRTNLKGCLTLDDS
jgi:hypothetical protein